MVKTAENTDEQITPPTLDLFHTFEAVARHRSFTLAADELCLTQSAVSRQIKTLEDALGLRLFRRLHRAIEVTADGRRLFESVARGLEDISACLAALRPDGGFLRPANSVPAGMTDSKLPDAQSGGEKGYTVSLATQAGATIRGSCNIILPRERMQAGNGVW